MSDIRFNVVIGKGGVGRTLVSILNGVRSARQGKRTLICELNTDESVSKYLRSPKSNGEIISVSENLWAVNIRPESALMEYADMKLKVPKVSKLVFKNPLVNALISFVPGMNELLMLGKAFNHEREQDAQGIPKWDRVIVDAPATGHGITLLGLPTVIADAVPSGNMHDEALLMQSLLRDPNKTSVDVVTTPEPLPIHETLELCDELKERLALPVHRLFVNCVPQTLLSDASLATLEAAKMNDSRIAKWVIGEEHYARSYRDRLASLLKLELKLQLIPELDALAYDGLTDAHLNTLLGGDVI